MPIGVLSVLLNVYLLVAILTEKELRTINLYPIAVQVICDIYTSLTFIHLSFQIILMQRLDVESRDYTLTGKIWDWLRSNSYVNPDYFTELSLWKYFLIFGQNKINYYTTSLCMLTIAIERYILICNPYAAKRILTKRNRRFLALVLSAVLFFHSFHDFFCAWGPFWGIFTRFRVEICFFNREKVFSIMFLFSFFIIPVG